MKIPKRLQPLVDDGLVDEVISQLMSGKEATVYMVRCGDDIRCAKVYKEANKRSFEKAVIAVAHARWKKAQNMAENNKKMLGRMPKLKPFIH
jgi:serine/threonine-protein kinase RIO1